MSLTYWTLVVWVKAASVLAPVPPAPLDGPYDTLQECRLAAKSYAGMETKGAHFSCEKHEDESIEPSSSDDGDAAQTKACQALQSKGFLISCGTDSLDESFGSSDCQDEHNGMVVCTTHGTPLPR